MKRPRLKDIVLTTGLAFFGSTKDADSVRSSLDRPDVDGAKIEKKVEDTNKDDEDSELFVNYSIKEDKDLDNEDGVHAEGEDKKMEKIKEKIENIGKDTVEKQKDFVSNFLFKEASEFDSKNLSKDFDYEFEATRISKKIQEKLWREKFLKADRLFKSYFSDILEDREYREELNSYIRKFCSEYDVPVSVMYGVLAVESGGDNSSKSSANAFGVFQVRNIVLKELKRVNYLTDKDWSKNDLKDLEDNCRVSAAYLSYLHKMYGQWGFALMAYNTGPSNFEKGILKRLKKIDPSLRGKSRRKIRSDYGGFANLFDKKGVGFLHACSKNGAKLCETDYGEYAVEAMVFAPAVEEVFAGMADDEQKQKEISLNYF